MDQAMVGNSWSERATECCDEPAILRMQRDPVIARAKSRLDNAASRLDRDLKQRFGERAYTAEELVAELGAAFLSAEFGFDGDVRSAGYIATWIELLRADKRAFFTACSKASRAADFFRGLAHARTRLILGTSLEPLTGSRRL